MSKISLLNELLHNYDYGCPLAAECNWYTDDTRKLSADYNRAIVESSHNFYLGNCDNIPDIQPALATETLHLPFAKTIIETDIAVQISDQSSVLKIDTAFLCCSDLSKDLKMYESLKTKCPDVAQGILITPLLLCKYWPNEHPDKAISIVSNNGVSNVLFMKDDALAYMELYPEDYDNKDSRAIYDAMQVHSLNASFTSIASSFLALLNCSNVTYKKIEAPHKLNKARKRANKPIKLSYHVLTLDVKPTKEVLINDGIAIPPTGISSRHSPSPHLRRGHVRHYKAIPPNESGYTPRPQPFTRFIFDMMIGSGALSEKDYELIF